jgi:hypothetical protein
VTALRARQVILASSGESMRPPPRAIASTWPSPTASHAHTASTSNVPPTMRPGLPATARASVRHPAATSNARQAITVYAMYNGVTGRISATNRGARQREHETHLRRSVAAQRGGNSRYCADRADDRSDDRCEAADQLVMAIQLRRRSHTGRSTRC